MVEDRFRLLPGDAGEPVEEVVQPGAGLEVLEERLDGLAGAAEDPDAADPIRGAFDSGALRPVQHRSNSSKEAGDLQDGEVRPARCQPSLLALSEPGPARTPAIPGAAPRRQRAAGLRVA